MLKAGLNAKYTIIESAGGGRFVSWIYHSARQGLWEIMPRVLWAREGHLYQTRGERGTS